MSGVYSPRHSWPTVVEVYLHRSIKEESQIQVAKSQEVVRILGHYKRHDGVSGDQVCALSDLNQMSMQREYRGCPVWIKEDHESNLCITFGDWGWSIGPLSDSPIAYKPNGRKDKLPATGWKLHNSWIYSGFDSDCPIRVEGVSRLELAKETVVSGIFDFFWKSKSSEAIGVAPKAEHVANDALANKATQEIFAVAMTAVDCRPGSVVLEVNDGSQFKLGQKIVIGRATPKEEENTLTGLEPLWLMQPTNFGHPRGSTVEAVTGEAHMWSTTWPDISQEQKEWAKVQCMSCWSGTQNCFAATFDEVWKFIEDNSRVKRTSRTQQELKEPTLEALTIPRSQQVASFMPQQRAQASNEPKVSSASSRSRAELVEVSCAFKKLTDESAGLSARLDKFYSDSRGNSPMQSRNVIEDQPERRAQAFAEALMVSLQEETDNLKVENQKLREQVESTKIGREMEVDGMTREARRLEEEMLRAQASAAECASVAEREAARVLELDAVLIAIRKECADDMRRMEEEHQQKLREVQIEVGSTTLNTTELQRALEMKQVECDDLAIAFQSEQNRCRELEGALQSEQVRWQDVQSVVTSEQARNSELLIALRAEETRCSDLQLRCNELEIVVRAEEARCAEFQTALQVEQDRCNEIADAFQSEQTRCIEFQTVLQAEQSRLVEFQGALQAEQERYATCQREMQQLKIDLQGDNEAEYGNLQSALTLGEARLAELQGTLQAAEERCEELNLALQTEQETRLEFEARYIELENAFRAGEMRTGSEQAGDLRSIELQNALEVVEARCQELEVALQREQATKGDFETGMRLEAGRIVELENALLLEKERFAELNSSWLSDRALCTEFQNQLEVAQARCVELESEAKQSEFAKSRETIASEEIAMLKAKCSTLEGQLLQEQSLRAAEVNAFASEVNSLKEDIARLSRERERVSLVAREEVVVPAPIVPTKEMATVALDRHDGKLTYVTGEDRNHDGIPDILQQPQRAQVIRPVPVSRQDVPATYANMVRRMESEGIAQRVEGFSKSINASPASSVRLVQASLQRPSTGQRLGVQSTPAVVLPSSAPAMKLSPVLRSSKLR